MQRRLFTYYQIVIVLINWQRFKLIYVINIRDVYGGFKELEVVWVEYSTETSRPANYKTIN